MKVVSLMTNRMVNPLGFDFSELRLSYKVTDTKAKKQAWARVTLATDPEMNSIVYDSGERDGINLSLIHILRRRPICPGWAL